MDKSNKQPTARLATPNGSAPLRKFPQLGPDQNQDLVSFLLQQHTWDLPGMGFWQRKICHGEETPNKKMDGSKKTVQAFSGIQTRDADTSKRGLGGRRPLTH